MKIALSGVRFGLKSYAFDFRTKLDDTKRTYYIPLYYIPLYFILKSKTRQKHFNLFQRAVLRFETSEQNPKTCLLEVPSLDVNVGPFKNS